MIRLKRSRGESSLGRGFTRFASLACVLLAAGCGVADDGDSQSDEVDSVSGAITGGWTTLKLINGWKNYNTNDAPAIGVVNGVVRFRGALSGGTATNDCPFLLPTAFRPYFTINGVTSVGADALWMRTVLANSVGGALMYEPDTFAGQSPTRNCVHVLQDGVSGLGSAAQVFTSLDGVTFDRTMNDSTVLTPADGWASIYILRQHGQNGAYVKLVDGFVRFQGALGPAASPTTLLFTLPPQFRPAQYTYVPVTVGGYGRLIVAPTGEVYVQTAVPLTSTTVSLEGASYSLTTGGTVPTLLNGWVPYSARAVKVRVSGGVVRFEGSVKSGTSQTLMQLPTTMRPAHTTYLTSDSFAAAQGRIYVQTDGYVVIQYPSLSVSSGFTSLDGLSFSF